MRKYVKVYVDFPLFRRFSSLCRFLGLKMSDVLEKWMKDFIEKHKDQAPLDFYLAEKAGKPQIINFNFTQNNYLILAHIARLDPDKWLNDLDNLNPDTLSPREAEFWKQKLPELILEASKTLEEIRMIGQGEEYAEMLQDLITKASELLQKILKKKTRRELIHA